jgi:hypothetical protein
VIDILLVAVRTSVLPKFLPCSRLVGWPTAPADQKTGKSLDYDPNKDVQTYSGRANPTADNPIMVQDLIRSPVSLFFHSSRVRRSSGLEIRRVP